MSLVLTADSKHAFRISVGNVEGFVRPQFHCDPNSGRRTIRLVIDGPGAFIVNRVPLSALPEGAARQR